MADLKDNLQSLATQIGTDIKGIKASVKATDDKVGVLTSLSTTNQTSIVDAINEVKANIVTAQGGAVTEQAVDTKLQAKQDKLTPEGKLSIVKEGTQTKIKVDLSDYVDNSALTTKLGDYTTSTDLNTTLGSYAKTSELNTKLNDYTTTAVLNTRLDSKQNKLTAGSGITIGADGTIQASVNLSTMATKQELTDKIQEAVTNLVNGADATMDTFKEVQEALRSDKTVTTALTSSVANKVDYSQAQSLSTEQKQQACVNLGIGDPTVDLVSVYTTARDS